MRAWEIIRTDSSGAAPAVLGLFADREMAVERMAHLPDGETLQLVEREFPDVGLPAARCPDCGGAYTVIKATRGESLKNADYEACADCGRRWE